MTITVFDILGRRVRVLQSGIQRAGSYQVDSDGRGASGFPVSSGVYFVGMEGLNSSGAVTVLQRRMIYLK